VGSTPIFATTVFIIKIIMGLLDFLKKKEKVVEKPIVVEKPAIVEELKAVKKPAKKVKTLKAVPLDPLVAECYKAIEKEIAKDHHDEAKEIINLSSEEIRNEFLGYHKKDQGNICCLVLDDAKRKLIAAGKLEYNKEGAFGHPFML
jgi:hypothetical protein